jgi:hypothetical protein
MADIFAYVAHKDGKWAGVCSIFAGRESVKEFLAEFAADGFMLQPVKDREEYNALLDSLKPWHSTDDVSAVGESNG